MKLAKLKGVEFINPNVLIDWRMQEEELVNILKCELSKSHFYVFDAKLPGVNVDVSNRITFYNWGFKLEIIVTQTKISRKENSKTIYVDTGKMNVLKEYVEKRFGSPKFFSRIFSALNKPFYNHMWKFENIKLKHKYQDSVIGFYECLLFNVEY